MRKKGGGKRWREYVEVCNERNAQVIPVSWCAYSESTPIYLGRFMDLLWTVWVQLRLRTSLAPACACIHAKSLQWCPTLCNPTVDSPPGSSLHGILQARIREWVFMPFFRGSSQLMDRTHISYGSCIVGRFFTTEPQGKPHSSLYWFSKSTVAPKAHRFRLIVGI